MQQGASNVRNTVTCGIQHHRSQRDREPELKREGQGQRAFDP